VSEFVFRLVFFLRKDLLRNLSVLFVFAFFFFNNSLYWDFAGAISASVKDPAGSSSMKERPGMKSQPKRRPTGISFRERTVQAGSSEEDLGRWHVRIPVASCHP